MPKYLFAVSDGQTLDLTDPIDLANETVAAKEAHRALSELVADLPKDARAELRIAVEDEDGTVLYQASLTFRGETAVDMANKGADGAPKP